MGSIADAFQGATGEVLSAGFNIDVDIVMCLDITESMVMGEVINMMKSHIMNFSSALRDGVKSDSKHISSIRLKIIAFRDWQYDGICEDPNETWFKESDFFVLLQNDKETDQFQLVADFLESLEAKGGGDQPETSLEALAMAMRSDWRTNGEHMRHIVCLMTDDVYKPLENFYAISPDKQQELINRGTPPDMPANMSQLIECWNCSPEAYKRKDSEELGEYYMNSRYERLLLITPGKVEWYEVLSTFQHAQLCELFDENNNVTLDWSVLVDELSKSIK